MSALIETLREEHGAIARLLALVRAAGANTAEGRRLLEQLREEVALHLAREERHLFRPLLAVAQPTRLKSTLAILAGEASDLQGEAEAFFARIRAGAGELEVARGFGRLYAALGERMRREETSLFPVFEREDGRAGEAHPSGEIG